MFRVLINSAGLFAVSVCLIHAGDDDKSKRAERRLLSVQTRAKKIPRVADADDPAGFLSRETHRLMNRCVALSRSSYEFDRMLEAVDDLLDAREDLVAAGRDRRSRKNADETRGDTAKRLERSYFRVQQGEYFARLSGDKQGAEYVLRSRQLYQKARAAYDSEEYHRANKLASASSELVNVLENLAQAAVRKPEPPVLE